MGNILLVTAFINATFGYEITVNVGTVPTSYVAEKRNTSSAQVQERTQNVGVKVASGAWSLTKGTVSFVYDNKETLAKLGVLATTAVIG